MSGQEPDVGFVGLPANAFPFKLEFIDSESGRVTWSAEVTGPGALAVPAGRDTNDGKPVRVRLTYGDGDVMVRDCEH